MFTQPSVNQIASAYQGNPQPLAQKVEADKKQHGGIPQDLRQLLALNDITQGRNAMGIQQALQIPTNMPTVAQSLQQQAQQAIQARLMEQAREQQRLQQKPPVLPLGTPQPRRQPQGIDMLRTNVGEEYAKGGIVAFDDSGGVTDQQIKDWFAANQGASDTDIYNAMQQYNVGTQQLTNAMGFDPTEVNRRYDIQARNDIFSPDRSRAEQESMLNDFYQDKGLNINQLGQTNFGYDTDTRESRLANAPYTNLYEEYQRDLAATGRYDAPEDAQFRTQAVYEPGALGSRGAIKLYDTATGQHLTNVDVGNQVQAFELLDKFGVDPRSYKQALGQSFGAAGVPDWQKDDYDYLMGYKPRLTADATAKYLAAPNLKEATVNDLRGRDMGGNPVKDRTLALHMTEMIDALKSKSGMTNTTEATDLLHQFLPVQGLVNWSAIEKSKDPAKALVGTLNYLQTKGLINLDPNTGPLSQLNQYKPDSITTGRKLKYTGQEALRNLGLKGLASGGKVAHFDGVTGSEVKDNRSWIERLLYSNLTPAEQARKDALEAQAEANRKTPTKANLERDINMAQVNRTDPNKTQEVFERLGMVTRQEQPTQQVIGERPKENAPAAAPNERVNTAVSTQPGGGGDKAPSIRAALDKAGIINLPIDDAARKRVQGIMALDPDAQERLAQQKFKQQVGEKDLSIYDKAAAELEARKQKLNAPKAGYEAMMDYLENIALSGGRTSAEAGARGASRQKQMQLAREAQQNELMDKILELGAKKSEAQYAAKEKLYQVGQERYKDVFKNAFDAAKDLLKSDDEARRLAQDAVLKQAELDNRLQTARIGAHDNLMSRAQALMKATPGLGLEEAMKRASLAAGATQLESTEVRALQAFNTAKAKLAEKYPEWSMPNTPKGREMRARYEQELAQARIDAGLPALGINALPSAGGPTSSNIRSQADAIISGGR